MLSVTDTIKILIVSVTGFVEKIERLSGRQLIPEKSGPGKNK